MIELDPNAAAAGQQQQAEPIGDILWVKFGGNKYIKGVTTNVENPGSSTVAPAVVDEIGAIVTPMAKQVIITWTDGTITRFILNIDTLITIHYKVNKPSMIEVPTLVPPMNVHG